MKRPDDMFYGEDECRILTANYAKISVQKQLFFVRAENWGRWCMDPQNCQMEAKINKRKNKHTGEVSWVIQKKTVMLHHEQCLSSMMISSRELAQQKSFRKAFKTGRTSRKNLAAAVANYLWSWAM